ncbi:acyltransferase family protein [Aquamicrobium defluvii]|uniref:Peptidoglycan/LPS O-acetylase OafA/YrhL n=1 Tax=Aquamicrobium defluvii TaxID=69279 RepID=A0A4R6YET3_9HYPH|nr:acyltransferase family protein [Aquamicrobium defluvii]TDR34655.1 peptidoglycan/LPS O-acetylase OafA/YrhL [Aquamicrobium defluvii]
MKSLNRHPSAPDRRNDIQGLRAIGAILVAIFHIAEWGVSGGVDVFFVVSGYFLSIGYVRRSSSGNYINLIDHLSRFIIRTVPEIAIVLTAITLAALLFSSPVEWQNVLRGLFFSSIYLQNYWLIFSGQDYLSRDETISFTQHFWAVSLIGQSYFLWYFVARISEKLAILYKTRPENFLASVLTVIAITSLAWSVYWTSADSAAAYFDLATRYWQFAAGALAGIFTTSITWTAERRLCVSMSWLGLALILSCGYLVGERFDFPGYISLWPVGSALLILLFGRQSDYRNAGKLLSLTPLATLGSVSFGIYLWHWPIYVVFWRLTGGNISVFHGVFIIILSIVLAFGSNRLGNWISMRILRPERGQWISSSAVGLILAALSIFFLASERLISTGASRVERLFVEGSSIITPGPLTARRDNPIVYEIGCHQNATNPVVKSCSFGSQTPNRIVALVGGSHSAHWLPALIEIAATHNWRVISMTKSNCAFADPSDASIFVEESYHPSCSEWINTATEMLIEQRPDYVFTLATRPIFSSPDARGTSAVIGERIPIGYVRSFERLAAEGVSVIAIRDTPWMGFDVPTCVFAPLLSIEKNSCRRPRQSVLDDKGLEEGLANLPLNVAYVDMTDWFCADDWCDAVRDGILMYRDRHHITATYSKHISRALYNRITEALTNQRALTR